jgi:hypothetical protein
MIIIMLEKKNRLNQNTAKKKTKLLNLFEKEEN